MRGSRAETGTRRATTPILVLVLAAFSMTGCGTGSSKTRDVGARSAQSGTATTSTSVASSNESEHSGGPETSVRSIAVIDADTICKRLNEELKRHEPGNGGQVSPTAHIRAALELRALVELRKLTPPASIAHDYNAMLADRRTLIEETPKLGRAIDAKDTRTEVRVFATSSTVIHRMKNMAARDGFTYCGEVG
jgi:hypothetical protein